MTQFPKRLIEVDLPIKRISAHARREKSIRHGHISTLHIWWARRPLAACRAVICAALWPDPADAQCPPAFVKVARAEMQKWTTHERQSLLSAESRVHFENLRKSPENSVDPVHLRTLLLDFIADFANWDSSTLPEYLETSRALTQAAHEALGGAPGTRPLVVDPFAGGGSIPLEALRVGADAFASDLNPVPVLLNKVVLEYIPKYGQRLADEVRKWGAWIKQEAENELAEFYPKDADGATPIAYLWARTIQCEGPGCGAEVPLIRSLWLARKAKSSIAIKLVPNRDAKRVDFKIIVKKRDGWVNQDDPSEKIPDPNFDGTVKRGSGTCPCCGYTTPVARVREQLRTRHGGGNDARMFCVVSTRTAEQGRFFRLPNELDEKVVRRSSEELAARNKANNGLLSLVPDERLDIRGIRHTWAMLYGLEAWGDYFTSRQSLALITLHRLTKETEKKLDRVDGVLAKAVHTCLALAVDTCADHNSSLCSWRVYTLDTSHVFGRQALSMAWDFSETCSAGDSTGSFIGAIDKMSRVIEGLSCISGSNADVTTASATEHPLPSGSAHAFVTDPPYYDAVPYAFLSDFFYVWLKRSLGEVHDSLFKEDLVPKDPEIVVDRTHELSNTTHDIAFYERELTKAFNEGRRILRSDGIGTIVFASKTTSSWEAILKAVVDAGWIITGSWPIDTEMATKVAAIGQARLMSSVHLVCRPRANPDGSIRKDEIGDWRDVLQALPIRIHEWMPRLAEEGVVGADAIFACLGPALEIFSRYSRVEKASGETVALKEYLEQVWAAVAKEALALVFKDADTTAFEADARLTAMWLWTLKADAAEDATFGAEETDDDDDEAKGKGGKTKGGFTLEYDAARKIAQGLGAHLEDLTSLVEISGETARLLPVAERAQHLFGKDDATLAGQGAKRKKRDPQMDMFTVLGDAEAAESTFGETKVSRVGETALDRVHQSMILFAAGRSEALKRFLVDDAIGQDQRFWSLAQALSALYPSSTEEKRWVDGVLARKKGLGF